MAKSEAPAVKAAKNVAETRTAKNAHVAIAIYYLIVF
jgi:hypothetical protein